MKGSRAWLGWLLGGALLLAGAAQEQRRAERGHVAGHGSKRPAKAPLRRVAARVTKPARPQERTPPATRPRAHGLAARPTARAREATRSRRAFEALYASGRLLRRCEGAGKRVALTFDDGPAPVTPEVLAMLARHHARATFFVVGKRVRRFPQALRAIERAGHQLENHTWSHELGRPYTRRCFVLEGPRHQREEVERTDRAVGHPTRYLRVPGGLFTSRSSVPEVAHALHKVVVNWDVAGDTPGASYILRGKITGKIPDDLLRHYLRAIRPGSIVLMHPENRYDAPYTLPILEPLIVALQQRGYKLVTLDELVTATGSATPPPTHPLGGQAPRRHSL